MINKKFKREKSIYMYGKHAVTEALVNMPKAIRKMHLDGSIIKDQSFMKLVQRHSVPYVKMKGDEAKTKVGRDTIHQGIIAEINSFSIYANLDDIIESSSKVENPCIVVLDELQDPHNVGAIIRSAAAFGALAVVIPEHNQSPITGTVIKTSAGMVFRIPVVKVGNINQSIRTLKDNDFTVSGLIMEGTTKLKNIDFKGKNVYVVGNESEGIRAKTLELCDITLSIPMDKRCESLNAATAASVVLYEYSRQNFK